MDDWGGLVDEEVHDGVNEAHNNTGEDSAPNIHLDTREEIDCQNNHDGVDNDGREAHGQNGERKGEHFDEGFDDGVDEGEDEPGDREEHPGVFID